MFLLSFQFVIAQSIYNQNSIEISIQKPVNTNISIFPNPTTDYFKISTDLSISKIEIYNIIGKKIKTLKNTNSNTFAVSDLRNGIYLVRIFNSKNKVLKVIRLGINNQRP